MSGRVHFGSHATAQLDFQSMHVSVRLRPAPETQPARLRQMLRAAERACVVLQTLRDGVATTVDIDLPAALHSSTRIDPGRTPV